MSDDLEARLIGSIATTAAVAVANGKWARRAEERSAVFEAVATELRAVWDQLGNCAHDFDPECARCEWLRPLSNALRGVDEMRGAEAHSDLSQSDTTGPGTLDP